MGVELGKVVVFSSLERGVRVLQDQSTLDVQ